MSSTPNSELRPTLTIVLIEDSPLMRQTLMTLLADVVGIAVVGEAADESTAIELLQREQPRLAIIDLELQAGSGFGVLQAIFKAPERFGHPRTVVFSSHDHRVVREHCFALGVEGFFDKATQFNDLLAYVRQTLPA